MMVSLLFLFLCSLLPCWAPGMMVSPVFCLFSSYLVLWALGMMVSLLCVLLKFCLFNFFVFKFSCEIMSDNCESKSRLRMSYDKTCVRILDSALIITMFVCLA